jgi:GMP synthase (glutamine-hydrolysing)
MDGGVKRLLVLKAGTTAPSVRITVGDYDRWFARALAPFDVRLEVVATSLGEPPPARARDFDAVLVTGSPQSVTEEAPWMRRTAGWLREAAEQRVPVLGVCFGHQLLGAAYGAVVRRSRAGREIGTVSCRLTAAGRADPLFEGVPVTFEVQATHEDVVEDAPPEVEILAANGAAANQAFRVGDHVRAVQFHPELDPASLRALVLARRPALEAEARARGEEPGERVRALLAGLRATPAGPRVLANFLARFT